MRIFLLLIAVALSLEAATFKLYLKGGGDLLVNEYEVTGDRVRYYSSERSQWEQIPLDLVDVERTERVAERTQKRLESMRRETQAVRRAERRAHTELHQVPIEDGVYYFADNQATPLKQAEVETDVNKTRGFLKVIAPVPIIPGKNTLVIPGASAEFATAEDRPAFFIRQSKLARFGIVRVEPEQKKERRVVQTIQIVPQSQEMFEEQADVEVFRQQFAEGVYKIWPVQALEPGEYAVIDYTAGEADLRVWDFAVRPTS